MTFRAIASRPLRNTLTTFAALGVGLAIGLACQAMFAHRSSLAAPAPRPPEVSWSTFDPSEQAALENALRVADEVHAASAGRIALPDGARFALDVTSNRDGTVELHAMPPSGAWRAEPVWVPRPSRTRA